MLDLPRNKHLSRQNWAMAMTHALKIKNRLLTAVALQGQSPISLRQPEVLDSRRFPLQPYATLVAAHIPLDTQNNGSGRSILGHYVEFSEDHRGGILIFNPKIRTTTVRNTYKALGLVEEQRLDIIIYVIDSASPVSTYNTFAYSFHYRRVYYLCCWTVRFFPEVYSSILLPLRTTHPFPSYPQTRCLPLISFAMSRLRIRPSLLNPTCHNRSFGTVLIINGLAPVHVLSLSNHFYVMLTVISARSTYYSVPYYGSLSRHTK